jgi:arylsulfatase
MFKSDVHEGGIVSPFIAYYPEMIKENQINHSPGHIIDVLATCAELAGATYPEVFNGVKIQPTPGKSLVPVFKGKTVKREADICFEHFGNKAIIRDSLKLVIQHKHTDWEVFNLKADRSETNNLIKEIEPDVLNGLFEGYYSWATDVESYPKDVVSSRTVIKRYD